jgi:hypothetical protein
VHFSYSLSTAAVPLIKIIIKYLLRQVGCINVPNRFLLIEALANPIKPITLQ